MKEKGERQGRALVGFIVLINGDVAQAQALQATHPEFGKAAVKAVEKWKFTPATRNGRAVNIRLQVPIEFNLAR